MVQRRLTASLDSLQQLPTHCTTIEAAKRLGMAVRSIQMMVDRGELQGWKTAGGHRRITLASVEAWIRQRGQGGAASAEPPVRGPVPAQPVQAAPDAPGGGRPKVLVIEDSVHYQRLLQLLLAQQFPALDLHVAGDGVSGLALCGALRPDVLIVDILLPGIDGATLITGLRSSAQFSSSQLIVLTSLDEAQREPYAFALQGIPVVHKTRLLAELPALLRSSLAAPPRATA